MYTPRINPFAPLLRSLMARRAFRTQPLCLVDVGASGGIERYWRQFEPDLAAYGFEPMIEECARLNAAERSAAIRYFACSLGCDDFVSLLPAERREAWSEMPYPRSSAAGAQQSMGLSYGEAVSVAQPQSMSREFTTLDRFFGTRPPQSIDFIKVDTDGHDYEVLLGAKAVLRERRVLGVLVEAPMQGVLHPHAPLFANIDRFLREQGFALFDFEPHRYSRACLPESFVFDLPGETRGGQVIAADALYFRDACAPGYAAHWSFDFTPAELLKLACLLELFGLPDCAAEILLTRRDALQSLVAIDASLDILASDLHQRPLAYRTLMESFASDPARFLGSAVPADEAAHRASLGALHAELKAMRRSRSWRITAPLRALYRWLGRRTSR